MKIHDRPTVTRSFENGTGTQTTQVLFGTEEYEHEEVMCDGIAVSFAPTPYGVDIEIMATKDEEIASLVPIDHPWEADDLIVMAARGITERMVDLNGAA